MPEKIKITIDDKTVEIKQDTFLLDAITQAGIEVPTLCYHKDLSPSGSCRLCVCEIEDKRGKKKLVTSCNYPVRDEIKVSTASEKVLKHRKIHSS